MNKTIVVVSGGFDPIHKGHIRLIKEAKKLGDKLIVILNNDNWLFTKKGYVFMDESNRFEVVSALRYVDDVYITKHIKNGSDLSICDALKEIKPNIFANGGDRFFNNTLEVDICKNLGIKMVFYVGGVKLASSSELIKNVRIV